MAPVLRRVAAVAAAAVTAVALAATPAHATNGNNYILNMGAGRLGVMHLLDGDYTQGNFDQLLPQYAKTNVYFSDVDLRGGLLHRCRLLRLGVEALGRERQLGRAAGRLPHG